MKFKKTLCIRDKVFGRDDIVAMWHFVAQQPDALKSGEATIRIENDGQEVSASTDEVFDTNNFTRRPIKTIYIQYRSANWTSSIDITIVIEDSYWFSRSCVKICGVSEEWVNSCSEKIRDLVDDANNVTLLTQILNKGGLYALEGAIIFMAVPIFMSVIIPHIKALTSIAFLRFATAVTYWALVALLYWWAMKTGKHFPVVDIDIDGSHALNRQRMIKQLWAILSTIVFPIIIGVWLR